MIPLIESHPISRLEGRNGIGKTMAIRLLQLCTGDWPYGAADAGSWNALREGIGRVEVRCTNLIGAGEVRWMVDPNLWPIDATTSFPIVASSGEHAVCSSTLIDEVPATHEEVRRLLRVHRLIGDETLIDSIREAVREREQATVRERRTIDKKLEGMRDRLDDLSGLARVLRTSYRRERVDALARVEAALTEIIGHEQQAGARRDEVRDLRIRTQQLASLADDDQDPEGHLQQLEGSLRQLRTDQTDMRAKQRTLDMQAEADARLLVDIETLERKLDEHHERRGEALAIFNKKTAAVGLGGLSPDDERGNLRDEAAEAERKLKGLRDSQALLDSGPQVQELGDRVIEVVEDPQHRRLLDVPFVEASAGQSLTPGDLADGIRLRRESLEREAASPNVERLRAAIEDAVQRTRDLRDAGAAQRRYRRRGSEIAKARAKLKELAAQLSGSEGQLFAELEARIAESGDREDELNAERDQLLQRMGQIGSGTSLATLRTRLHNEIADAGLEPSKLDEAYDLAAEALGDWVTKRKAAEETLEAARSSLRSVDAEREEAATQLRADGHWWTALDRRLENAPSSEEVFEGYAAAMETALDATVQRLDDLDNLLDAVAAGLQAGVTGVRPPGNPLAAKVLAGLERRLGEAYFSQPTIAEALFGGGTLRAFDLIAARIDWVAPDGEPYTRPLQAFSSGQRAFAYTRARLQRLRSESPVANRLVVLDEFGAFLERARMDLLERYLSEEVVGELADQALIVLPLGRSPDELVGEDAERRYVIVPVDQ